MRVAVQAAIQLDIGPAAYSNLVTAAFDEFSESFQLLSDEIARGVVFQLASLVIELGRAVADEDLRLVQVKASRNTIARRKSY